jgi:putative tryptophan/tyrosine transport system substrate-binding protein
MSLAKLSSVVLAFVCLTILADAQCQPAPGMHRIAFVNSGPAAANANNFAAFRLGLAELGYIEGRNLVLDVRWADQKVDMLPRLINELLDLKPDVIVSTGGPATARAVKNATTTVPIVFITGNPVAEMIVPNLARPGGNATGFSLLAGDLEAKRLELLRQIVPGAKRVALIWNPTQPYVEGIFKSTEAAAGRLGMTLLPWKARNRAELEQSFAEIVAAKADALFVISDPVLGFERARIVEFAAANRLPGIYFWREFTEIGGLASYGTNLAAVYGRSATYVDQILRGAKPGDLPIQQPTTFEFVINATSAKALGITLPRAVRQRADEVID